MCDPCPHVVLISRGNGSLRFLGPVRMGTPPALASLFAPAVLPSEDDAVGSCPASPVIFSHHLGCPRVGQNFTVARPPGERSTRVSLARVIPT